MKRILLIANKNWEVEPILNALLNYKIRPSELPNPSQLNYPWTFLQGSPQPRAIWNSFKDVTIELWCIQDITDSKWHSSSSQGKNVCMPKIINYRIEKPSLVIALGTAAFNPDTENMNGCVVVGSNIFIHNYHPNGENSESKWDDSNFETLIESDIDSSFFSLLDEAMIDSIEQRLLKPFLNPSTVIQVISNKEYLGLSTVNVTDYGEYVKADKAGIDSILKAGISMNASSVETTHGVIRLHSDAPFVFISGIVDRIGYFKVEVEGMDAKGNVKKEAQNYTGSFNIGVCLAWLIPKIALFPLK